MQFIIKADNGRELTVARRIIEVDNSKAETEHSGQQALETGQGQQPLPTSPDKGNKSSKRAAVAVGGGGLGGSGAAAGAGAGGGAGQDPDDPPPTQWCRRCKGQCR